MILVWALLLPWELLLLLFETQLLPGLLLCTLGTAASVGAAAALYRNAAASRGAALYLGKLLLP